MNKVKIETDDLELFISKCIEFNNLGYKLTYYKKFSFIKFKYIYKAHSLHMPLEFY